MIVPSVTSALVVPLATGMSLSCVFSFLRSKRPNAKYVIWPRIDQKSSFKAIYFSGLIPIVIENKLCGDVVCTDMEAILKSMDSYQDEILCVLSTTSCFAPRIPDKIDEIAMACAAKDIPHVINNAYGLQSTKISRAIERSIVKGRVDAIVQSSDKNFLVPVGGAIICSPCESNVKEIAQMYPGRASVSPLLDLMISLLSMGSQKYKQLVEERESNFHYMRSQLEEIPNVKVLDTPENDISIAINLNCIATSDVKEIGSMLFSRFVSGARVVPRNAIKMVNGITFHGFGSHINEYPHQYITFAASLGQTKEEIDLAISRMRSILY